MKKWKKALLFILYGIYLSGCIQKEILPNSAISDTASTPQTKPIEQTPALTPIRIDNQLSTHTPSKTIIINPAETVQETMILDTSTPVPTLQQSEAIKVFRELFLSNGGCELPCLWGITPGITPEENLSSILFPIGHISSFAEENGIRHDFMIFVTDDIDIAENGYTFASFYVKQDVVSKIYIAGQYAMQTKNISLSDILLNFGEPSEVLISIFNDLLGNAYYIYLLYPKQGMLIQFSSDMEVIDNDAVICPLNPYGVNASKPGFYLFSPVGSVALDQINPAFGSKGFLPLNEVSPTMNKTTFFEIFKESSEDTCFKIPINN